MSLDILGFALGQKLRPYLKLATPDEPITADYYLYGTPNESGEVALADGDGYVVYNGAVLPKLPELPSEYKFKTIEKALGVYRLRAYTVRPYVVAPYMYVSETAKEIYYELGDTGTWVFVEETTWEPTTGRLASTGWANFDLLYEDGSVYQQGADPIPLASNEPVAAVYGDVKLPPLPEWNKTAYPHAYISNLENPKRFFAMFESEPLTASSNGYVSNLFPNATEYNCEYIDGKWVNYSGSFLNHKLVWSNTDVYHNEAAGGGLYLEETAPIPVYEPATEPRGVSL